MHIIVNVFGGAFGLGTNLKAVESKVAEQCKKELDEHTKLFGETIRAMREHIHNIQLETLKHQATAAETYMRRDSYYKASEDLKRDVNSAFDKIDRRLERMENTMLADKNH